jgi:hypothetical protein
MQTLRPTPSFQSHSQPEVPPVTHTPAVYEVDDDTDSALSHLPGTAAYYKSRAFKKKEKEGKIQEPARHDEDPAVSNDEDEEMEDTEPYKPKSLIMIFSRTTVRRSTTNDKFFLRMQRYNKRT